VDATDQGAQAGEWTRQDLVINGGLIAFGVVLVQAFLTSARLDASATVCVLAFAVAIPLLGALVLVGHQEAFVRRAAPSRLLGAAKVVGQTAAVLGVVAGFWHITWIAGLTIVVAGAVAIGVHSAALASLDGDGPAPPSG
jgi:hypothetical protein